MSAPAEDDGDDWCNDPTRGWRMETPEERRALAFDAALAGTYLPQDSA